ncbi:MULTISPECIES: hypothetical protein [unclassified Streptomyces]|uniref:hypothetical protein n=1 Tax=unclassified Streptomyces TaxID=2593676 RepID=UPI002DD95CFD|nr:MULTISPECIES: hypothetical protein [unclassified Streptomyces]WSA94904.1 hypothetical protein OIE63_27565 [Streptomyces sp. NBC_01795]WSB79324.1 hypothetical protein OHB04_28685 [Streptomyces sp. NBC_01775]WSS12470.1 hypothetical protein OG533_11525 [Streptomyces sp. NBC_01186]WSS41257.1 hypothetical protein OG220_12075 [Streptomyces sp. NBC_01187]
MRSTRYAKGAFVAATCALVLAPAGAAYAGSGPATGPSNKTLTRTTAPSPEGNPASKLAQAAGVCDDAVAIGTTGLIKKNGATIASVKQFYSKKCNTNYGYVWVWESFRKTAAPYDVTAGVYNYDDDATYGKKEWKATKQQEFWSDQANTVDHCTSGVGTLRPAGTPQPLQAFSQKRC